MKKRTILVVDDSKINRNILCKILGDEYSILQAENGEDAMSVLNKNSDIISVVLLDIVMPVLNGYDVLERMHSDSILSKIPVIVTSAQDSREAEEKALSLGANDFIIKPYFPTIIKHRVANTIYLRETAAFVNSVQYDSLTGLYSKEYFYLLAEDIIRKNPDEQYDIICCDVERFKLVNDLYGTKTGDELLKFLASIISNKIENFGICGRIGADMFAFLVKRTEEYKPLYFERAIEYVNRFNINLNIKLRFGIYAIEDTYTPVNIMCDRACLAKETIKGKYNTYFAFYDAKVRQKMLDEELITLTMEDALKENQFLVYFQPKYEIKTNRISGAEALVRWQNPKKGFMLPGEFIPLFEKNGFITSLDIYVWERCCQKIREWLDLGLNVPPLSANVSRADIYNPKLVDILVSLINKYNISPKYLHLEITETAYMENPQQLVAVVTQLKKLGFIIEMDDFGTGYSSLNMLSTLPIDVLKLDMKFVQGTKISSNRNILSFIISLAQWLHLAVTAEGVETQEQVQFLQSLNCNWAQGYYYAKPLPQSEFEKMLEKSHSFDEDSIIPLDDDLFSIKSAEKTIIIFSNGTFDYDLFNSSFKSSYHIIQMSSYTEIGNTVGRLKSNTAVVIINGCDISDMSCLKKIVSICKPFNVPTLLLKNSFDDFVSEALKAGVTDYILHPYTTHSFCNRIQNVLYNSQMIQFQKEREMTSILLEMKRRAEYDSLTGLLNRDEFENKINGFFYNNSSPEAILIIFDIDNLKNINDNMGHVTGDKLIGEIGDKIKEEFFETEIIGRVGGDEFAVFIPYKITHESLESKLRSICLGMDRRIGSFSVSCSAGVCLVPESGDNYGSIYANCDTALIFSKRVGKGTYNMFRHDMELPAKQGIEAKVSSLLDNISDAMFVSDAITSEIIYINDTAAQIVKRDKKSCVGSKCYEIFWDRCKNCDRCLLINGGVAEFYEEDAYLTDGKTKVHIRAKIGDWDGRRVKIHYLKPISS